MAQFIKVSHSTPLCKKIRNKVMRSKILLDFDAVYYCELLGGLKNTNKQRVMVVEPKKQKPTSYVANMPVIHSTIIHPMYLIVECDVRAASKFGFKLMAKQFNEQPFFRFDSAGTTDRNRYDDIPLREQSITTPHFHKYDERGRAMAYKTESIKNIEPHKANSTNCFVLFCNEANLRYDNVSYPSIQMLPGERMDLQLNFVDPNENVIFVP